MAFSAALALDAIDNQLVRLLDLHRFDLATRTKTRLFSIGSAQGKQFALIIGDLNPATKRPMSNQTVVLSVSPVPGIDGVLATGKPLIRRKRLRQTDSKVCVSDDKRGHRVADEAALSKLMRWYAAV